MRAVDLVASQRLPRLLILEQTSMPILAHLTEEASRAIGIAVLLVLLAAVTLTVAVIWGIVLLVRSSKRKRDGKSNGDEDSPSSLM